MDHLLDVSVIVPAYQAGDALPRCVNSLLAQDFDGEFEVILVASADSEKELPSIPPDPRLKVIFNVPRLRAPEARNAGVAASTGRSLAFTDAVVVAAPGWLSALVAAAGNGERVVAGSIGNGTPRSLAGTTEYLVEFLDLHPRRPPGTAWHGATCNLLLPRRLWETYGPWPAYPGGGEDTLLTSRARREGVFVFSPEAFVERRNRTKVIEVITHQYAIGKYTAHLGRIGPYKARPLVRYTVLAPVAAAGRLVSIYARVVVWTGNGMLMAIAMLPLVVAALTAWGLGLLVEGARIDLGRKSVPG